MPTPQSSAIATAFARRNIHYGWVVVAVTFLTLLVTAAAMGTPGVMIVPLEHEFGWEDAQISSALALRILLFGLFGPFAAAFMNRFGVRRVIVCALSLIAAGMLTSLMMTKLWQLVLLWGVVVGVGTGLTAMVLAATVATRWFNHRRGLVMGMLAASSATGQLIFLPLIAHLTTQFGWRIALVFVCGALAFTAVVVVVFMQDRPSNLDLPLYGETKVTPLPAAGTGLVTLLMSPINTLKDAARVPIFWVLFATFFVCGSSTNGLIQTHFITLCHDYGLAAVGAASVLAMMGAFDFIGTIGSGWLSDRFDNRWLLFWYYGLRGLSLLYLPFTDFTFYGLSLFAMFYGLDWIATVPPTVKLTADRFGPERAGMVFGWIFAGHQLGAASAAFGAGYIRTEYSTYLPAFFIAGTLCLVAAVLVLTVRKSSPRGIGVVAPAAARG
ncbi:MAG: MFS transporter [Xanthobacteraceae bacterium]